MSFLPYTEGVAKKQSVAASHTLSQWYLGGKREPPILKEEIWRDGNGAVTRYSLAYIDPQICSLDDGRVLGYDNAHGYHHRHFMGIETKYEFSGHEKLLRRFQREVNALRRKG
jgi:hypothetical protein